MGYITDLNSNWNRNRLNFNGNNFDDNRNGYAAGIALSKIFIMKTHKYIYPRIYSFSNLLLAYKKARKGKTKKIYVNLFEKNLLSNLLGLSEELKNQTYQPKPLKTFILKDPKTRKISKSEFKDRVIHHALVNTLEPIFDKTFIYDSCANRLNKGNLFAIDRFKKFIRKVSRNGKVVLNNFKDNNQIKGYCLKADIKHYFQEINHNILLSIIKRKIKDEKVIQLIQKVVNNNGEREGTGIPLGNLTSQFFANVYLNELDYFIKHKLKAKYYLRYVDDFVVLHNSKEQLNEWKIKIDKFLRNNLNLELHPDKSKILPLSKGIDFVGFRNFYHYKLLRKRNIRKMNSKINNFKNHKLTKEQLLASFEGWRAYAIWANTYKLRKNLFKKLNNL